MKPTTAEQAAPKRRGRPTPDDGGRDGRLNMRVRPDDKEAWRQAAAQAGDKDLSAWIERTLNAAASHKQ